MNSCSFALIAMGAVMEEEEWWVIVLKLFYLHQPTAASVFGYGFNNVIGFIINYVIRILGTVTVLFNFMLIVLSFRLVSTG